MQSTTGTDTTFKFTITGWNDWTDLKIDYWLCLIGMLQARLETDDLEGLSISLEKKLFCKARNTRNSCFCLVVCSFRSHFCHGEVKRTRWQISAKQCLDWWHPRNIKRNLRKLRRRSNKNYQKKLGITDYI